MANGLVGKDKPVTNNREATTLRPPLNEIADEIIDVLRREFPDAEYLVNGQIYGEEDLDLEIYAPEDQLMEIDRRANELTFRYWEETGHDVLPMVAPKEASPVH